MKNSLVRKAWAFALAVIMAMGVFTFAPVTALAATRLIVTLPSVNSNARGDDYDSQWKSGALDQYTDNWRYYTRECTSWARWCLATRNGITNGLEAIGNGKDWINSAKNLGYAVNSTPAVGAVACWTNGTYGHVAWVSSINNGVVSVEEYNWDGTGKFKASTVDDINKRRGSSVAGYIHFADISSNIPTNSTWNGANGVYKITHVASGKVLAVSDVVNGFAKEIKPQTWTGADNQKFVFTRLSDGSYKITGNSGNGALNVKGSGAALQNDGQLITLYDDWQDLPEQHWYIMTNSNGTVRFVAKHSGKVIDRADDTKVHQISIMEGNTNQEFTIESLSYVTRTDDIGSDFYALIINSPHSVGTVLTNDGGTTKFLPENHDKSQIMRFVRNTDDGTYSITAMSDGKAIDVQEGNKQSSRVYFYTLHKQDNQRFRIEKKSAADMYMFGVKSGPNLVLDAAGGQGNFADGTQVWTYTRNDTNAQWYEIRKIADVNAYLNPVTPNPTVSSIAIAANPAKTAYTVGDTLDTAGLTLTVNYSDNTKNTVTSGFTCAPTTLTTAGTQTVTVTYDGKSAVFTVEVTEASKGANSTAGLLNGIVLTATVTDVAVKFDWMPNDNPLGYRIYRSRYSGVEGISITDFPIPADVNGQYVDVNVDPYTQYYYTIRAVEAEADFNMVTVEIIPERLGPASEELSVYTEVIIEPPKPPEPEEKKNFILMTIGQETMQVNDKMKRIDPDQAGTKPIILNGRTLTPIRAIIETMQGSVGWEGAESKVTLEAYSRTLEMWLNNKRLLVNGQETEMDVAPSSINGRTMLPLRFVSENLGCPIAWIGSSQQIIITFYTYE